MEPVATLPVGGEGGWDRGGCMEVGEVSGDVPKIELVTDGM